jgi:streptogramin lyase
MTIWRKPFVPFSFVLLLFATRHALALDPALRLTQYRHTTWRVQYGLPPASPQWISQTPDGYLLVGIPPLGAYQFDGVRLVPWLPPVAPSNDVYDVLPAKAGGFWFIDANGVTHVNGKRVLSHFNLLGAPSGLVGNRVVEDKNGSIWLVLDGVRDSAGPLCHVTDLAARCFGAAAGMPFSRADSIMSDGKGGFWIGTDTALVHWQADKHQIYGVKALRSNAGQDGISSLVPDAGGFLWVGIDRKGPGLGLETFDGRHFRPFVTPSFDGSTLEVLAMHRDRDQNLWVATETGIYRIHGEAVDHLGMADGLTGDSVKGLYEDRQGTIWVPTSNGLDSFSDSGITSFSHTEGLSTDTVYSVLVSRDGTIWLAEYGSLDRLRNGHVSSIRPADGLPGEQVTSLLEDHAGRMWVGVDDGLFLYEQHHFRPVLGPDHRPLGLVGGITEDRDGNIWVECASNPRKLVRIRNLRVQEELSSSQVPAGHALAADPKGGVWVSTLDGNLVLLQHGALRKFPLHIAGEQPRQIEAEPDGSVLVASPNAGLVRLRMGKVQRLTKKNGLPCDGVFGFVRDDDKVLWLEAPCGYIAIADSEIRRWWARPDAAVQYRLFDHLDGARPLRAVFNPTAKSPDGHLWFVAQVLQTFDPRHLLSDRLEPPAHIEQIIANHKTYEIDPGAKANITLPARTQELEIDYTALNLAVPEKTIFRYRLDGFDREWHDVGKRRQALYTNLAPGSYRFRVSASNDGQVWNGTGADLDLSIAHAWYQTNWFRAAYAAAFFGTVWALYRLRLRQIGREKNLHQEVQTALARSYRSRQRSRRTDRRSCPLHGQESARHKRRRGAQRCDR